MGKENLAFGDIETEKKIYSYKSPALLRDVHIEKVFASHKIFFLVGKDWNFILCNKTTIWYLGFKSG